MRIRTGVAGTLLGTALALIAGTLSAQEGRDTVTGVVEGHGFPKIKIAVPQSISDLPDDANAQEIVATLREDLGYSGFFDVLDPTLYRLVPPDPAPAGKKERHEDWLSIGADALVRLRMRNDGDRIDLQAMLYDNNGEGQLLFGRRYGGQVELRRRIAHNVADDLVRHYTGRPGVAMSRIAFVSTHGDGKEVYLMDYDGKRIRRITTSNTLNLAPTWSPDGNQLAYVSWQSKQPGVFVMTSEGELQQLQIVRGELSAAPDWSPDGRKLVYSSDAAGNSELYVLDRDRGRNTRVTHHQAIDTAPAFSPNGREIAFTSDRTGRPQVYIMDAEGLNVRRVSWSGTYNDSAAWSPLGDKLVYSSRIDGRFELMLLDLATERTSRLTWDDGNNEDPRWSPDGRHIVFSSNRGGSYQIYTMRADGRSVRQLTRGPASATPDWSH